MTRSVIENPVTSNWSPDIDFRGMAPESWDCIDCGVNTAPGIMNRVQLEQAFTIANSAPNTINNQSEVYMVKSKVWKASGIGDMDGCLCIGCLEKRLGRILTPKDFMRNHPFNQDRVPGTRLLQARRKGFTEWVERQPDGSHKLCRVNGSTVEVTDLTGRLQQ